MPGLMTAVNRLDKSKGLDLIIHTPGGEIDATEQIVFYLLATFSKTTSEAIVPQLAMSAGTMIALSTKEILMGLYSSLGPIDPQVRGAPAHGILEEFNEIKKAYADSPKESCGWVPILQKYTPTLIGACEKAIELAEKMPGTWLQTNMFAYDGEEAATKAVVVLNALGSHKKTLSHGRHINIEEARKLGLKILPLEENKDLQNAILSLHHCYTVTFSLTPAAAIIENHLGMRFVNFTAMAQLPQIIVGPQPIQIS